MFSSSDKIVTVLPSFNGGGAERVALNYIKHLTADLGYHIDILVFRDSGALRTAFTSLESVTITTVSGGIWRSPGQQQRFGDWQYVLSFVRPTHLFAMRLGKCLGAKVVCREANPFALRGLGLRPLIVQFLTIFFYAIFRPAIVFNSKGTFESFRFLSVLCKHTTIYNPIFKASDVNSRRLKKHSGSDASAPKDGFNIAVIGRDVPQKNLGLALKIASKFAQRQPDEFKFHFFPGSEGLSVRHRELAKNLGNVLVYPFTENEKIFNNMNALLCTSHFEGFGNIFVEAGFWDVPVIATYGKGSIRELVCEGGLGFCVEGRDQEELCRMIKNVCNKAKVTSPKRVNALLENCLVESFHSNMQELTR